jgi:hypothetical protein
MAKVETHEVPEHTLIVLRDLTLPDDPEVVRQMVAGLKRDLGREHVAILHVLDYTSQVEILGPDDSLPDWFYRKLGEAKAEAERRYTPPKPARPPVMIPKNSVMDVKEEEN